MEKNLTYELAYEELQQITIAIENETVTIDQLAVKLKRAADLISFCASRLRTTESEVAKILDQLNHDD
jgi:exodeoxyribonuclease VII small subunit